MTWTRDAYVRAALDAELGSLRNTSSGRACAAFRAAAAIGEFVGAGAVGHEEAEELLLGAALETGLPEREARSHIRRGLLRGEKTPRVLPQHAPQALKASQLLKPAATMEQRSNRPPKAEVDALWSASVPVGSDDDAVEWFRRRFGDGGDFFIRQVETDDLARAIPHGLLLPSWAWSRAGSWADTGHRLLFRLWDHTGEAVSLCARCLDPDTQPKSLAPCGFSVKGLVLADPVAARLLSGSASQSDEASDVIVAEGEPDWLLWSARLRDLQGAASACFGVEAGAWCQAIADRVPKGAKVVVRTHADEAGGTYARQIVDTLCERCEIFRSGPGDANAETEDDNDRYLGGTLPRDPFADAERVNPYSADPEEREAPVWGDPIPIGPTGGVPTFPVDTLPDWLRDWVTALADALQCPVDLPAMLALAVLSLCTAKKYSVSVRSDWPEPINLYVAVALKSGESKSPAFTVATKPVARFVAEERRRREPEIRIATARADIGEKRIEQLKARAAKAADPAEHAKLLNLVDEAVFEQSGRQIPAPLRLILDDVTAESLEVVLRQQGGRIAIMSDEGGPFELMGGRYSDNVPNLDIYLKGHSGSPISTDRIGREGGSVQNPAITIGLAVQPEVITALKDKKGFRGRGLLARFLWAVPKSLVGSREADSPPLPEDIRAAYEEGVTALLEVPAEKDELGEVSPRVLPFSKRAYSLLVDFKRKIEPSLGPSGELESVADWGNKLGGTVVRLAALLHLADRSRDALDGHLQPIGEDEMHR
ncbi:MAG: YfjI family protein, partial [Candidatus Eisenbacteria bacterium]